jgi:hypothetical protein
VIGGPGTFVIAAQSYDVFADAILKKIITEIAINDGAGTSRHSHSEAPTIAGEGGRHKTD